MIRFRLQSSGSLFASLTATESPSVHKVWQPIYPWTRLIYYYNASQDVGGFLVRLVAPSSLLTSPSLLFCPSMALSIFLPAAVGEVTSGRYLLIIRSCTPPQFLPSALAPVSGYAIYAFFLIPLLCILGNRPYWPCPIVAPFSGLHNHSAAYILYIPSR